MPPSTSRAGAFAWTIGYSQARQAFARPTAPHSQQTATHPVAPCDLRKIGVRIRALRDDPRLFLIAVAPPPSARDHLDASIQVDVMPNLMHGICRLRLIVAASLAHRADQREMGWSHRLQSNPSKASYSR